MVVLFRFGVVIKVKHSSPFWVSSSLVFSLSGVIEVCLFCG